MTGRMSGTSYNCGASDRLEYARRGGLTGGVSAIVHHVLQYTTSRDASSPLHTANFPCQSHPILESQVSIPCHAPRALPPMPLRPPSMLQTFTFRTIAFIVPSPSLPALSPLLPSLAVTEP